MQGAECEQRVLNFRLEGLDFSEQFGLVPVLVLVLREEELVEPLDSHVGILGRLVLESAEFSCKVVKVFLDFEVGMGRIVKILEPHVNFVFVVVIVKFESRVQFRSKFLQLLDTLLASLVENFNRLENHVMGSVEELGVH